MRTIAAALVEVEPGGMRKLHWHSSNDEWQCHLEGQGRMGVSAADGQARTFDFMAGDVGYVPFAMGHCVESTGTAPAARAKTCSSSWLPWLPLPRGRSLRPTRSGSAPLDGHPMACGTAGTRPCHRTLVRGI